MTSPASALRAMRPVKTYTCIQCGCRFTASDNRARYCSNRCRQAAKYARMKAMTRHQESVYRAIIKNGPVICGLHSPGVLRTLDVLVSKGLLEKTREGERYFRYEIKDRSAHQ